MGQWVFSRATFGALSGYTSGWCDLAHWGMVLAGDLALRFENDVELLTAGDVYYCPVGPPGHQFQVADSATTIDYTPYDSLLESGRKAAWRVSAFNRLTKGDGAAAKPPARPRAGTPRSSGDGIDTSVTTPGAAPAEFEALPREGDLTRTPVRASRRGGLRWVRSLPAVALRNLRIG